MSKRQKNKVISIIIRDAKWAAAVINHRFPPGQITNLGILNRLNTFFSGLHDVSINYHCYELIDARKLLGQFTQLQDEGHSILESLAIMNTKMIENPSIYINDQMRGDPEIVQRLKDMVGNEIGQRRYFGIYYNPLYLLFAHFGLFRPDGAYATDLEKCDYNPDHQVSLLHDRQLIADYRNIFDDFFVNLNREIAEGPITDDKMDILNIALSYHQLNGTLHECPVFKNRLHDFLDYILEKGMTGHNQARFVLNVLFYLYDPNHTLIQADLKEIIPKLKPILEQAIPPLPADIPSPSELTEIITGKKPLAADALNKLEDNLDDFLVALTLHLFLFASDSRYDPESLPEIRNYLRFMATAITQPDEGQNPIIRADDDRIRQLSTLDSILSEQRKAISDKVPFRLAKQLTTKGLAGQDNIRMLDQLNSLFQLFELYFLMEDIASSLRVQNPEAKFSKLTRVTDSFSKGNKLGVDNLHRNINPLVLFPGIVTEETLRSQPDLFFKLLIGIKPANPAALPEHIEVLSVLASLSSKPDVCFQNIGTYLKYYFVGNETIKAVRYDRLRFLHYMVRPGTPDKLANVVFPILLKIFPAEPISMLDHLNVLSQIAERLPDRDAKFAEIFNYLIEFLRLKRVKDIPVIGLSIALHALQIDSKLNPKIKTRLWNHLESRRLFPNHFLIQFLRFTGNPHCFLRDDLKIQSQQLFSDEELETRKRKLSGFLNKAPLSLIGLNRTKLLPYLAHFALNEEEENDLNYVNDQYQTFLRALNSLNDSYSETLKTRERERHAIEEQIRKKNAVKVKLQKIVDELNSLNSKIDEIMSFDLGKFSAAKNALPPEPTAPESNESDLASMQGTKANLENYLLQSNQRRSALLSLKDKCLNSSLKLLELEEQQEKILAQLPDGSIIKPEHDSTEIKFQAAKLEKWAETLEAEEVKLNQEIKNTRSKIEQLTFQIHAKIRRLEKEEAEQKRPKTPAEKTADALECVAVKFSKPPAEKNHIHPIDRLEGELARLRQDFDPARVSEMEMANVKINGFPMSKLIHKLMILRKPGTQKFEMIFTLNGTEMVCELDENGALILRDVPEEIATKHHDTLQLLFNKLALLLLNEEESTDITIRLSNGNRNNKHITFTRTSTARRIKTAHTFIANKLFKQYSFQTPDGKLIDLNNASAQNYASLEQALKEILSNHQFFEVTGQVLTPIDEDQMVEKIKAGKDNFIYFTYVTIHPRKIKNAVKEERIALYLKTYHGLPSGPGGLLSDRQRQYIETIVSGAVKDPFLRLDPDHELNVSFVHAAARGVHEQRIHTTIVFPYIKVVDLAEIIHRKR